MKRLSQIRLNFFKNIRNITDYKICLLIENNPKLQTIESNIKHINEKTVKAFIEKALNNPKANYKFVAINIKEILIIDNTFPKNLLIKELM